MEIGVAPYDKQWQGETFIERNVVHYNCCNVHCCGLLMNSVSHIESGTR
jgi:hypothetical protein